MIPFAPPPKGPGFLLSLTLAFRDLRGGLKGFGVFLACLALGVASIAGVGSVARSLSDGLAREGRVILGGDVAFSLIHRPAGEPERQFFAGTGRVTETATMRAMARSTAGDATLVDLKAVDAAYPLVGAFQSEPAQDLPTALKEENGRHGALVDPAVLARLDLKVGDEVSVGNATLLIRGRIVKEPDAIAGGFDFGPRLLVSRAALDASGLVQPGSLVRFTYKVALPDGARPEAVKALTEEAERLFPNAGWQVRTRDNASASLTQNIERFSQFLTIVGLVALVVGGVGVANGVASFIERKRGTIATLKSLGATGGRIFSIYLVEILVVALVGIVLGLALGASLPFGVAWAFSDILPIPIAPALEAQELGLAALYGLLVAFAFALWPLGHAHDVPVSALFREHVSAQSQWPRPRYMALVAFAVAALVALAVSTAFDRRVALVFVGAVAAIFVLLRVVALAIMALARRVPRPRSTELRLALANIHRPGALTPSVVLSLGLGLALLVAITLIDGSIRRQIESALPEQAPSFFFIDIPNAEGDRFRDFLAAGAPGARINRVPMLRGRLVSLNGVAAADVKASQDAAWVLRGDRGLTHSATIPEGSRLTAGSWWAPDHSGSNLVSFDRKLAAGLGLKVGDKIRVNVLGREIEATIANLRTVEWETLGINFVMVFSPNTFRGAPYQYLATVTYPDGATTQTELDLMRKVTAEFPSVISIRVKDALATVGELAQQLGLAIRAASGITLVASVLVLAGALAAGHRYRLYDAVILKTLGATRRRILTAFALEYLMLGAATALFGLAAGTAAAWAVTTQVMRLSFSFDAAGAGAAALGALVVTVLLGLLGTWRLLGHKPAGVLRDL